MLRGQSSMKGFRHAAELNLASGRHAYSQAQSVREPLGVQLQQTRAGAGGPDASNRRSGMPAEVVMTAHHSTGEGEVQFQTDEIGVDQVLSGSLRLFSQRHESAYENGAGVLHAG